MKRFLTIALLVIAAAASAQTKKVSVMGDSYSTFRGIIPDGYAIFYPTQATDVSTVDQMWWDLYIKANGYELEKNDSWSGSTICTTGYGGVNSTNSAFISRIGRLGDPDIIFVFGGTNDAWANSPVGEYKYSDWTTEDCKSFRPAFAFLLHSLKAFYPKAKIYSLLNSELREEINQSMRTVCKHYNVQLIELHDIDKQANHPSVSGMKAISDQLQAAIKN